MQFDPKTMQAYETALEGFTAHYQGVTPWDIGKPQAPFVKLAQSIASPVLDAGCGAGNTALHLAALGKTVTGIDFVAEAIRRAKTAVAERGLPVRFLVKDAMTLADWDERFASVVDSGLFHVYAGPESREARERYVAGLAHVLEPGGRLYLLTFTDEAREGGASLRDLCDAFAHGWEIESAELVLGEVNPAFAAEHPDAYPDGGPKMWFAVIRRLPAS